MALDGASRIVCSVAWEELLLGRWARVAKLSRPPPALFLESRRYDLRKPDAYVNSLIDVIPRDDSMVDLEISFSRLTAGIAINHMFGKSLMSLNPYKNCKLIVRRGN